MVIVQITNPPLERPPHTAVFTCVMWEIAAIIGALVGAIYSLGEHGIIRSWKGKTQEPLPPGWRFVLAVTFMMAVAYEAETFRGFLLVGLAGIGALKMAELLTSAIIETARGY